MGSVDSDNGTFGGDGGDENFLAGGLDNSSASGGVEPSVPTPPVVQPPPPASALPAYTAPSTEAPRTPFSGSYQTPSDSVEYDLVDSGTGPVGSSKLPWIFAVVAAVFLLGGGGIFAASVLGASGGEESPEAAIDSMLAAMEEEDFVAVAELLEPSERRTLAEPALTELLPELIRLGVFEESADAGDVEGLDLAFTNVEHRVERLVDADDIAHVFITGGELATNIDGGALPLSNDFDSAGFSSEQSQSLVEPDVPLVFVERDGSWYFSLLFTAAENVRLDAGESLPSIDAAPAAVPSDSPEAAIEGMFAAMTDFDLETVIGHMDPDEMAVLYRYSPLFLDDAQAALDEAQGDLRGENIFWDITDWDFDVDESGDDAVVSVRGFTVNVAAQDVEFAMTYSRDQLSGNFTFADEFNTAQGTIDATTTNIAIGGVFDELIFDGTLSIEPEQNTISGQVTFDGEVFDGSVMLDPEGVCSQVTFSASDGTSESFCIEEDFGVDGLGPLLEAMEDWPTEFPGIEMRTRQTDGGWYVSPIGTLFDGALASLEGLEEGDFDDVFDPVASVAGGVALDPFSVLDDLNGGSTDFLITEEEAVTSDFDDALDESFDEAFAPEPRSTGQVSNIIVESGQSREFQGELAENVIDSFIVDLGEGEVVTVTALGEDNFLDTVLVVDGPDGERVARNDDANPPLPSGTFDSRLDFTVREPGMYSIDVSGFDEFDSGGYTLIIDRDVAPAVVEEREETPEAPREPSAPAPSPDEAVTRIEGTVGDPGEFVLPIELFVGEPITIAVETADVNELDPVVELELNGEPIGANDDAPADAPVANNRDSFLAPTIFEDGEYTIIVSGFAGRTGDFTMTIRRG